MRRFFFALLILATLPGKAQLACPDSANLVLNPSFEDSLACPYLLGAISWANYWYSPNSNSPDYFHECTSVPGNFWGYQYARTGKAYAGFVTYYTSANSREYVGGQLLDTLLPQKKYCISFYVSLSNFSTLRTNNLGAYFSDSQQYVGNNFVLPFVPQFNDTVVRGDTATWIRISGEYIAAGGERFFIIGNFFPDTLTETDTLVQNPGYFAYYYIDDVDIHCCDIDTGDTTTTQPPDYPEILLTPNPNSGTMQLSGNFPSGAYLEFYDALGQLVRRVEIGEGNRMQTIYAPQLAPGVYLYRITGNGLELKQGKVLVAR